MTPPTYDLLAADLDGTLLGPDYRMSARTLSALRRARESGVAVMVLTGRILAAARPVLQRTGLDDVWLAAHNGAVLQRLPNGDVMSARLLPRDAALAALEILGTERERVNLALAESPTGQGRLFLAAPPTPGMRRYLDSIPLEPVVVSDLRELASDPGLELVEVTVSGHTDVVGTLRRAVVDELGDSVSVVATTYPARDLTVLDILPRGCSKAAALREVANRLGVPRNRIAAIGDNENDAEMLLLAGLGILMGNAPPRLREFLAQHGVVVTESHDREGAAQAIERYVLGEGRPLRQ